ncbi:MAG: ornithine--oxo-acid transaminase [Opitutaceae bacterium]|nr:ornithine--oxo-acid transaminase [Cytophagales bacterium]
MANQSELIIELEQKVSAHNYHPLPVVIHTAKGVWIKDIEGKKYLDMLSSYSAINQGHLHPRIVKAAQKQLKKVSLTSRGFYNDQMAPFLKKLTLITGYDKALLMNSGAEAVETAIKAARRWGYLKKGIEPDTAEIIVCNNNFHGRTTTIIGFSSDISNRKGYGPFTPGFITIPFSNKEALEKAINKNTVAFLLEPIQGEAGIQIPYPGYLKDVAEICRINNVLLLVDEIQTGLGRTGKLFCFQHENVKPDIVIIGKALGGGIYPVSGILANNVIMNIAFEPGSHGSTFGGNPLACAIASESIDVIIEEELAMRSEKLGMYFLNRLKLLNLKTVKEVRGKGLFIGIELNEKTGNARPFTERLVKEGVLAKETQKNIIRFAPPLIIKKKEIDWTIKRIEKVLG